MAFTAAPPTAIRWFGPAAIALSAAASAAATAARNPFHPGAWPLCPFHAATGLYCPFCGSTRAVYALAHGQWALVVGNNPLLPVWLFIACWGWLRWLSRLELIPWHVPSLGATRWVRYWLPAVVVVFWVARNLPGLRILAPHGHP